MVFGASTETWQLGQRVEVAVSRRVARSHSGTVRLRPPNKKILMASARDQREGPAPRGPGPGGAPSKMEAAKPATQGWRKTARAGTEVPLHNREIRAKSAGGSSDRGDLEDVEEPRGYPRARSSSSALRGRKVEPRSVVWMSWTSERRSSPFKWPRERMRSAKDLTGAEAEE